LGTGVGHSPGRATSDCSPLSWCDLVSHIASVAISTLDSAHTVLLFLLPAFRKRDGFLPTHLTDKKRALYPYASKQGSYGALR
jgi:hypothetical protein